MKDSIQQSFTLISLLPVAVVIIGAFFTYYYTTQIEKRRIIRSLRPDLIKYIYILYSYTKGLVETSNIHGYRSGGVVIGWNTLHSENDEGARKHIMWQLENLEPQLAFERHNIESYNIKIVETVSQIYSILSLIKKYYPETKYDKLYMDITGRLKIVDETHNFYNYDALSQNEYDALKITLKSEIRSRVNALNEECTTAILNIESII